MPRLLVAISPHGFGHTAQVAPVVNALRQRLPDLELTLRSTVSRQLLESRFEGEFDLQAEADDFGMVQHDALDVDVEASYRGYRSLHARWEKELERVSYRLEESAPDLVLADVPYVTLAAAANTGIPSIAMCCLNWADIFWHYCQHEQGSAVIHEQMLLAYNSASLFLQTEPSMPMPELANTRPIGPVAASGRNRRDELIEQQGLADGMQLVLVAMGGITMRLPMEQWPKFPGVRFIVQRNWQIKRDDVVELESLQMAFNDVLASCDLLLTKPGYGSFTEAAANGIPVLYVPRENWPEQPWLVEWLQQRGICAAIDRELLLKGEIEQPLRLLLDQGRYPPVEPSGVEEASRLIAERLMS